jgi:SAM-dependent methyltransferase
MPLFADPEAAVARQYREFPYPPRNPDDERDGLRPTALGGLLRVNGLLWGGRRWLESLTLLDAGCGTGDSTIYMAAQAPSARVVALDRSPAALEVTRRRAAVRGLTNIEFVEASLLDLPRLGLGPFDYIVCSGVLHHLPEPEAGLSALTSVLADDGGLGLMLYGAHGRAPIYQVQELLRRLDTGEPLHDRVALAAEVVQVLSPDHFFKLGKLEDRLSDVRTYGAAGLVDLLLHAQDRAYTVDGIHALLESCGARLLEFQRPLFYRPETYTLTAAMLARVVGLPERDRQAVAELLNGRILKHGFYAVKGSWTPDTPRAMDDPHDIRPLCYEPALADWLQRLEPAPQPFRLASSEGFQISRDLTAADCALLSAVDGHRTLAGVYERAAAVLGAAGIAVAADELAGAWWGLSEDLGLAGYLGYGWAERSA